MHQLKISTFNLRSNFDCVDHRFSLIEDLIKKYDPDILGLQELADCQMGLIQQLGYQIYNEFTYRGSSTAVAIKTTNQYPNQLQVKETFTHRYDNKTYMIIADIIYHNCEIRVANTHLIDDRSVDGDNNHQMVIHHCIQNYNPDVIMGDFNSPLEKPLHQLLYRNQYYTMDNVPGIKVSKWACTWPTGINCPGYDKVGDPGIIDHIYIKNNRKMRFTPDYSLYYKMFDKGERKVINSWDIYASDHCMVNTKISCEN